MASNIVLLPDRGTNLYKNLDNELNIEISSTSPENSISIENILVVIGNSILSDDKKHGLYFPQYNKILLTIPSDEYYMIVNLGDNELNVNLSEDPNTHKVIYDPYLYEKEEHNSFDPETFKKDHPVPEGYVDTLSKWYSMKFTYPNENYIFIRPGLGISFQTHEKRKEIWEVVRGSPIIISGDTLFYNTKQGDRFEHPFKGLHGIINPTDEWVLIIESYEGTFEETDITRVFNPNNYR